MKNKFQAVELIEKKMEEGIISAFINTVLTREPMVIETL